jgi:hypothetical protein
VFIVLLQAAPAAAGTGLFVGAAENNARSLDAGVAKTKMDLAARAGLGVVRMVVLWSPGRTTVGGDDLVALGNATTAAQLDGVRLILSVYPQTARSAPLTSRARSEFALFVASIAKQFPSITDYVIGNEPNLNLFWMPQFSANGVDLAARSYELLLARTYDALKSVSDAINVIGGAVSPHGQDKPRSVRPTHSPTAFIRDLGAAYRASKRRKPIMDMFAIHPYLIPSRLPPTFAHPKTTSIGIADYDKLVRLLTYAFKGTAQRGETLPIVYDEFGYQTVVPPSKRFVYNHLASPAAKDAITEARQAAYYKQAFALAACQPTVAGLLIFHVVDERDARAWQSGLYYGNNTAKSSLAAVRAAALAAHDGRLAQCGRDKTTDNVDGVVFYEASTAAPRTLQVQFTCAQPCTYEVRVIDAKTSDIVAATDGKAVGLQTSQLPVDELDPGRYQYALRVFKCGKPGTSETRFSRPFVVGTDVTPPESLVPSGEMFPTLVPTVPAQA